MVLPEVEKQKLAGKTPPTFSTKRRDSARHLCSVSERECHHIVVTQFPITCVTGNPSLERREVQCSKRYELQKVETVFNSCQHRRNRTAMNDDGTPPTTPRVNVVQGHLPLNITLSTLRCLFCRPLEQLELYRQRGLEGATQHWSEISSLT